MLKKQSISIFLKRILGFNKKNKKINNPIFTLKKEGESIRSWYSRIETRISQVSDPYLARHMREYLLGVRLKAIEDFDLALLESSHYSTVLALEGKGVAYQVIMAKIDSMSYLLGDQELIYIARAGDGVSKTEGFEDVELNQIYWELLAIQYGLSKDGLRH